METKTINDDARHRHTRQAMRERERMPHRTKSLSSKTLTATEHRISATHIEKRQLTMAMPHTTTYAQSKVHESFFSFTKSNGFG